MELNRISLLLYGWYKSSNNDRGMGGKQFSFPVRVSECVLELSYMLEIHHLQGF